MVQGYTVIILIIAGEDMLLYLTALGLKKMKQWRWGVEDIVADPVHNSKPLIN